MLAHWLGIVGESLNFIGGVLLAYELLFRRRLRRNEKGYEELARHGIKHALSSTTYKGLRISSYNFPRDAADADSFKMGVWGVSFILVGFLFLVAYHGLEIYQESAHQKHQVSDCRTQIDQEK